MITIENLVRDYGTTRAVDYLSLTVKKGEILGLLGPNGAGKSTTLKILTGYLEPTAGSVTIGGINAAEEPLQVRRMIGYLPETTPLYTDMLVYDYLDTMARIHGLFGSGRADRIRELAELCDINDVMHKPIGTLSKGYRQRVGLAFVLLSDPEILVLDEPTSGLDPNQIMEIRSIIRDIGKRKTVIFSTHILSEAESTCDRIVIINKGKIVADGTAETLKKSLQGGSRLTLSLKDAGENLVRQAFDGLGAEISIETDPDEEKALLVTLSGSEDLRGKVWPILKKQDWTVLKLDQQKQSLENIFRELTTQEAAE
jgi:ABC-2 type transport system ATP-binding protein